MDPTTESYAEVAHPAPALVWLAELARRSVTWPDRHAALANRIVENVDEKETLERVLLRLKTSSVEERESLFQSIDLDEPAKLSHVAQGQQDEATYLNRSLPRAKRRREIERSTSAEQDEEEEEESFNEPALEASQFLSIDEAGEVNTFGPTSTLYNAVARPQPPKDRSLEAVRNQLFASAALQRQLEHSIGNLPDIDGVPIDLATHLLELYWNRPHHAFLPIYRPKFTRDLVTGGPYASKFLSNAIFAAASKYSDRDEVRDDPSDPRTAGGRFFRRCEGLLTAESPFPQSTTPHVAGLLLLGSALLARGEISKSWLFTGLAIRMVYDLGIHLDCNVDGLTVEDIELRRRLFWSAFIYDKIQSLYLGRPFMIHPEDANVSCELLDFMEERELFTPYLDPHTQNGSRLGTKKLSTPLHSVSTFQPPKGNPDYITLIEASDLGTRNYQPFSPFSLG
ncbi:hypothetical protein AYO22_02624 [Fonsecaea multimorphosa]|nr:hypothetical protein AYO22_02624 [Fonsecaea multimorphosa]